MQIARTESNVKRTDFEMRRKIDIALEEMEAQLTAAIKSYPDLRKRLRQVLFEAKDKINAEQTFS